MVEHLGCVDELYFLDDNSEGRLALACHLYRKLDQKMRGGEAEGTQIHFPQRPRAVRSLADRSYWKAHKWGGMQVLYVPEVGK